MTAPQVFLDIDLSPQPGSGFGYYYPTVQVTDPTEGITLTTSPQGVSFDGTAKSIQLYATDNANMGPAGWAWFLDFSQNPFVPGKPSPITFFAPVGPISYTATSATPAVFTWTTNAAFMAAFPNNVLPNGTALVLSGTAPTGFTNGTTYYVVNSSALGFSLAATRGGSAIASTGTGSGTFTVTRYTYSGLVPQAASAVYTPFVTAALGASFKAPVVTQVPNIVFDGDSLTAGDGIAPVGQFPEGQDYPSQVVAALDPRGLYYNVGVGGERISVMITNAPTVVDTKLLAGANNVVVICGGSNDIWVEDINPYSRVVAYCQARKAAGWKVIVGTIGPRSDVGLPADFDTLRLACNASIRANWQTFADGIADFGADATIGATGASTNQIYYAGDGAHLNANGYAIRASITLTVLASMGINGSARRNISRPVGDMWIPAHQMYTVAGTTTPGLMPGTYYPSLKLSHGDTPIVACTYIPPVEWKQHWVVPVFARATGAVATGKVALATGSWPNGIFTTNATVALPFPTNWSTGVTFGADVQYTPAAANVINSPNHTAIAGSSSLTPRYTQNLFLKRDGANALDTCTDDIYLLGMYFRRNL